METKQKAKATQRSFDLKSRAKQTRLIKRKEDFITETNSDGLKRNEVSDMTFLFPVDLTYR